jgi:hypothetical protein
VPAQVAPCADLHRASSPRNIHANPRRHNDLPPQTPPRQKLRSCALSSDFPQKLGAAVCGAFPFIHAQKNLPVPTITLTTVTTVTYVKLRLFTLFILFTFADVMNPRTLITV